MNANRLHQALDPDAIFNKAKIYIHKAVARKEEGNVDEYQLWASLAIELLGKAALAKIHPSLIVDPNHYESLFAASGINISTDIKTITAKTLFERLRHLAPLFDEAVKKFCTGISLRRNAELHSGETPFRAMRLDVWEAQYWHASQVILKMMGPSLDDWLGVSQAETPRTIIKHAAEAKRQAVVVRLRRAKEAFEERKKADRERALREAESHHAFHYKNLFMPGSDHEWPCKCPACEGKGYLAGIQVGEEIVDTIDDEDGVWENVEESYSAEQFRCPVCGLSLDGSDEIGYASLEIEHSETKEREMEYEMEYGND